MSLWYDLEDKGDGHRSGKHLDEDGALPQHWGSTHLTWQAALASPKELEMMVYRYNHKAQEKRAKKKKKKLSRMDVVKQLFHAFINRSCAYDYPNHIGLLLFGSDIDLTCPLTPLYEAFRERVDSMRSKGDTKLYDALSMACDKLVAWRQEHSSEARLRIICLSDGDDTKSEQKAYKVAGQLQEHGIVLDAVNIGDTQSDMLLAICKATGGLCFAPDSLKAALQLNELETMLSSLERPPVEPRSLVRIRCERDLEVLSYSADIDVCEDSLVPARREEKKLLKAVLPMREVLQAEYEAGRRAGTVFAGDAKRLMLELRKLARLDHAHISIFPCERDIGFWKVLMQGPSGTPYRGGTWLLFLHFPADYPTNAPEVRFVTPIKHCNINVYGKVCHSILDRNYSPDTSVSTILQCVYGLLLSPDVSDPLDSTLALAFYDDSGLYETSIVAHTKQHASQCVEWWKQELGDDEVKLPDKCCRNCGKIGEKMKRCGRCKVKYCDAQCQRQHWPQHKRNCEAQIQLANTQA